MATVRSIAVLALLAACADDGAPVDTEEAGDDIDLGDMSADDMKADGEWGAALECKPVPNLPALPNPKITLSIDGLTLHLVDKTVGFDKVYPVGPGAIETDETSGEFRESFSYYPIAATGRQDFKITPSSIQPCKTWWTDKETGEKRPVFAGLPFMSFYGPYAIHGPIDNFRAPNGGTLRRGYVSHGCFRMEAADVLEVYARIKGVASVPVHLQREPERLSEGAEVDLAAKWIGAECSTDTECGYTNGFCAKNEYTGQGFCSARCTSTCADRKGQPTTFCVANPDAPGTGMCVAKVQAENFECRPYDHFAPAPETPRFNNPTVKANVCVPGSHGWVGDHCFSDDECGSGTTCRGQSETGPGICTMACDRYCSDQPGYADTFCAALPEYEVTDGQGSCVRQCTPSSNGAECPSDMECRPTARNGQPGVIRNVCQPRELDINL